ncbi:uncharacterized protein LOC127125483 [Lathyrus oleraceus]|uniref:Spindle and kinetochore-associated protein 3 n=1 Tax=Pisum sativum TaxID=3888 RepID=A0A9D4XRK7_PEA|nr:uncharacterized protein LOC127125483 [Pisum sativum]KAI5425193.1 hypothetical protein KIW84_031124 [Pisum sativum]
MSKDQISNFCNELSSFCNNLQSSTNALKQSIDRRPIPLDSASSTFVQSLNSRVSTATSGLEVLESMSSTVSFQELLGHCNEMFKINQTEMLQLEDHLKTYHGYVPASDVEEEDEVSDDKLDSLSSFYGSLSVADTGFKNYDDDALFDESMSLKQFGLSDACLASLALEDNVSSPELEKVPNLEADSENLKAPEAPSPSLKVLKSEFECLPTYMKNLASWEELLVAVDKINSSLSKKTSGCNFFGQDDIPSFDLGPKARSYLLLLVRMNHMVVELIDGLLSYRIL